MDDEESYSDLIGGEDGLETEDITESEYFEEDSEGRKKKHSYSFHLKKFEFKSSFNASSLLKKKHEKHVYRV